MSDVRQTNKQTNRQTGRPANRQTGPSPWALRRRQRDADALEAALGKLPKPSPKPALVVLVGLPGSGKSYFARELARRHPFAVLDSDALRQSLFRNPRHTLAEHARLFPAQHLLLERLLARGISAIADATNLKEANRRPLYELAQRHGAELLIVRLAAPAAVIRARLKDRTQAPHPEDRSTADLDVFRAMRQTAERVRRPHVNVDTSRDIGPALDNIVRQLQS